MLEVAVFVSGAVVGALALVFVFMVKKDLRVPATRPRHGSCPSCSAREDEWCAETCSLVDLFDDR